ncbi:TPA: LPXTG cell wall anchor domain-containing protein [Streptococcus suis]
MSTSASASESVSSSISASASMSFSVTNTKANLELQSELANKSLPEQVTTQKSKTEEKKMLPNTGEESPSLASLLGVGLLLGTFFIQRKKNASDQSND